MHTHREAASLRDSALKIQETAALVILRLEEENGALRVKLAEAEKRATPIITRSIWDEQ